MKRKVYLILICFLFSSCKIKSNYELLQHYNQNQLDNILSTGNFVLTFQKDFNDKKFRIYSNNIEREKKIFTIYRDEELIDSIAVLFYQNSANSENFISEDAICVECSSDKDPYIFIYTNYENEGFKVFPINAKGVTGICATKQKIYYSNEYDKKTVKTIDINTGLTFEYCETFTGGVSIFKYNNDILFNFDNNTYRINENSISQYGEYIQDIFIGKITEGEY